MFQPPSSPSFPPPGPLGAVPVTDVTPRRRGGVLPWLVALAAVALLWYFRDIAALFAGAFAIAYVLEPLVSRLQRLHVPRSLAIVIVLVASGVALTALLSVVVPDIVHEVTDLSATLPGRIRDQWVPGINRSLLVLRRQYHLRIPVTTDAWLAQLGMRASEIAPRSLNAVLSAASATISVVEFVLEIVIVLALSFYLLMDYRRLTDGVVELVPLRARHRFIAISAQIDQTMGRFVRGQFLVMILLGSLYAGGLTALGVPAGAGLGVFAGMISFVPYLGFLVALTLALLLAALDGGGTSHILVVLGYMAVVHVLDNTLITPRILGGASGLSPVVVILSLLAGARVGGFVGLLVAIPVAAMLRVLLAETVAYYRSTRFFTTVPEAVIAAAPGTLPDGTPIAHALSPTPESR